MPPKLSLLFINNDATCLLIILYLSAYNKYGNIFSLPISRYGWWALYFFLRRNEMLIRVKYQNDKFDYIKPWALDRLIQTNRIQAFCRKTEWVVIGIDNIRGIGEKQLPRPGKKEERSV